MNGFDGGIYIAHLVRLVCGNALDVGVLAYDDEDPAAVGRYPDHADTGP